VSFIFISMPLFQFLFPPNTMTWVSIRRWFLLWVFVSIGATSVQAQTLTQQTYKGTPHDEVQKSMMRRDWNNAFRITEEYLQEQPRDPQMRFWRARLLEQLNRTDEALDTYLDLSREYPELPEVQNNLGVMLAAKGRIDEARQAFEHALRNNPDYATAHENLGDILVHLAQRSYDSAIRLRGADKSLKQKTTALQPALQLTLTPP
jgi:tetratricopeptide (TPR) repeat protein